MCSLSTCSFKGFIYLFSERGKDRTKGRETSMCMRYVDRLSVGCEPPTGNPGTRLTWNRTSTLSVPSLALDPLGHTSQGTLNVLLP